VVAAEPAVLPLDAAFLVRALQTRLAVERIDTGLSATGTPSTVLFRPAAGRTFYGAGVEGDARPTGSFPGTGRRAQPGTGELARR
jgi:hypothetical protein